MPRAAELGLVALLAIAAPTFAAERVVCHVTYGGQTQLIEALPVASPYGVRTHAIGSFFRFRVVFRTEPADLAGIKIYTYADHDTGPALVHQASHAYAPETARRGGPDGFTGRQSVHEPIRDSELNYWCELKGDGK
nr:hypothetical protein [Dechloromonas sp.]